MPWFSAAAGCCRQTTIVLALCLLVLSCAMEAKFAWYAPPENPAIDARSNKAIPAETSDISMDESVRADAARTEISCLFVAIFAVAWLLAEEPAPANRFLSSARSTPSPINFSPQISFRPPPAR